jgi:hypothetical protein
MSSLENGEYKFRNQAGYQTPAGLSNFPTWFNPLPTPKGAKVIRPADIDFFLQSNVLDAAIIGEFKPAGFGDLGFAQSSSIVWVSKINERCYGIYIEDNNYDRRNNSPLNMDELYKITVYNRGRKITKWASLQSVYDAIAKWWDTGTLTIE